MDVRVLVVEDQTVIALMLADELTDRGHEVVGPASTSHEALHLANVHAPTYAFVDLDLETKAVGLSLTEHLTGRLGVSVIICTAQPGLARKVACGAIGLLTKPYSPKDAVSCLAIVAAVLDGAQSLPRFPLSFELLRRSM